HPVTEQVYGVDLVREQLRIARGLPMSVPEGPVVPRGWAIECRITSEDPVNGLLPSTGTIRWMAVPSGPGVRWETGVEQGSEVTLFYDSMLAKLIATGANRANAIDVMRRALGELVIVGVATNVPFHLCLLADPEFVAGKIDIQFLERRADLLSPPDDAPTLERLAVLVALLAEERRTSREPTTRGARAASGESTSLWTQVARREAIQ
ncbi:MAG: acetyl-CoA carboxylase biotin carboxylase subunit, partial [Gemmatimonadales bacterium]